MSETAAANAQDEATIRRDLAAAYRLAAHFGWDDLVATHMSARLPEPGHVFLINPFGLLFEEVTASNLIKINADGEVLEPTPHPVNKAGFVVHSAVHLGRPDAAAVIHLHTRDGVAVSMQEEGLLPLNQNAMVIGQDIAFHEYEGVADQLAERERLQADLRHKSLMLLRNHGTLSVGRSVGEAFVRIYFLEWSCTVQCRAFAGGRAIHQPDPAAVQSVGGRLTGDSMLAFSNDLVWPALLRKAYRLDPSFAD